MDISRLQCYPYLTLVTSKGSNARRERVSFLFLGFLSPLLFYFSFFFLRDFIFALGSPLDASHTHANIPRPMTQPSSFFLNLLFYTMCACPLFYPVGVFLLAPYADLPLFLLLCSLFILERNSWRVTWSFLLLSPSLPPPLLVSHVLMDWFQLAWGCLRSSTVFFIFPSFAFVFGWIWSVHFVLVDPRELWASLVVPWYLIPRPVLKKDLVSRSNDGLGFYAPTINNCPLPLSP